MRTLSEYFLTVPPALLCAVVCAALIVCAVMLFALAMEQADAWGK